MNLVVLGCVGVIVCILVLVTITVIRTIILRKNYERNKQLKLKPNHFVIHGQRLDDNAGMNDVKDGAWKIPLNENDLCREYPREYRAVDNLCQALKFRTVAESTDQDDDCWIPFEDMKKWMADAFPHTFKTLKREDTGDKHSLLLHWHSNNDELEPVLLLAHMDVVPEGKCDNWRHDPFSGIIEDYHYNAVADKDRKQSAERCYVYGRGALDCKINVISILQAVEILLEANYQPHRDIFIAFGCNEEVSGSTGMTSFGAAKICKTLAERGIHFSCVLDEGGFVITDQLRFLGRPVGAVSVGEKSQVSLRITCTRDGGHSSAAHNPTAPGVIGEIAAAIENTRGYVSLTRPVIEMLKRFGFEAPMKALVPILFLNTWLYKPAIIKALLTKPTTAALVSTMHATTMLSGSSAHNVVPDEASCVVNFRIVAGETREDVIEWTKARIPRKYRDCVTIETIMTSDANIFSPFDNENPYWRSVCESVISISEDAVVVPNYCMGGTDARWYNSLSDCVYRFAPQRISTEEMQLMHANNERISTENVVRSVLFFEDFIQRVNHQQ